MHKPLKISLVGDFINKLLFPVANSPLGENFKTKIPVERFNSYQNSAMIKNLIH